MEEIVKLSGVKLIYHSKNGENMAIRDLNLSVYKGEFLALVGPSGSGKTTILSLLAGILKPSEGEIQTSFDLKNKVGYMLQKDQLFNWRTIYKNILLGLEIKGKITKEDKEYAKYLLQKYGLGDVMHKYPPELSGGMKQKLALIAALIHDPKLIIMDEPFVGLDPKAAHEVKQLMRNICDNGGAIFFSTHVLEVAEKLCDKVAIIKNGKLIKEGLVNEVIGDDSLEDVFLELEG